MQLSNASRGFFKRLRRRAELHNRHRTATSPCNLLPLFKYFVWTGYNHFRTSQHSTGLVDTGSCARLGLQMMCSWGPVEELLSACGCSTSARSPPCFLHQASNVVSIQMFPTSQQKKVQIPEFPLHIGTRVHCTGCNKVTGKFKHWWLMTKDELNGVSQQSAT